MNLARQTCFWGLLRSATTASRRARSAAETSIVVPSRIRPRWGRLGRKGTNRLGHSTRCRLARSIESPSPLLNQEDSAVVQLSLQPARPNERPCFVRQNVRTPSNLHNKSGVTSHFMSKFQVAWHNRVVDVNRKDFRDHFLNILYAGWLYYVKNN